MEDKKKNETSGPKTSEGEDEIKASPEMCMHCFTVLIQQLKSSSKESKLKPTFSHTLPSPKSSSPLFVTWTKETEKSGELQYDLRGCIGTLQPKELISGIPEYALISAFSDRRFLPIAMDEVSKLKVCVSLLVNYEDRGKGLNSCYDWEVGVHGIIIRFAITTGRRYFFGDKQSTRRYSATFLPEVAKDQGWTQEQTIRALVRKAGYDGEVNVDILELIELTRYQSSKNSLTYKDYLLLYNPDDSQ